MEALLQRCKGDVLHAIELLVCSSTPPAPQHEESPKSAFSPLGPHQFHHPPHRRFLAAPYAGTGYLPTVIRPEYGIPMVGHPPHEMYGGTSDKASPGSATGSDKTSYSE